MASKASQMGVQMSTSSAEDRSEPVYIDVRSAGEFAGGALDGAVSLPLDQLSQGIGRLAPDPERELVLYCASGARSAYGCALLQQMGYTRVRNGGGLGALALATQRPVRRS